MSETKHTPGPWRTATANDWNGIEIETDRPRVKDRETICEMEWDDSFPYESDDHDSAKANARLIAAAPELLTALEMALPWLAKANNDNVFENCAVPNGGRHAQQLVEKSIAKAKGEK